MSEPSSRISTLDGVRGIAALIVVVHHLSLVARPSIDDTTWAWLTQSPLTILLAGTEWVLVFFVLSGLVVALPALRAGFSWLRYYPARILRLYLPVIGALLLATALILCVPRDPATMPEGSWMRDAHVASVTPLYFLENASLLKETYGINNVLWSLRWELFFSLLLPLFVWVALRGRRWSIALAALCACATVAGRLLHEDPLVYYPVFLLGTILAVNLDRLRDWTREVRHGSVVWSGLAVLAGTLLMASQLARPLAPADSPASDVLWGLSGVGAALIVVLAITWPTFGRVLDHRFPHWLGRISFSLYLVHVPLIATLAYLFGQERWWLTCLVGLPLSLLLAEGFYRVVEVPSHRLARATGDRVGALTRRRGSAAPKEAPAPARAEEPGLAPGTRTTT